MNPIDAPQCLSTAQVARLAGVHKDTLLRWLRAGLVREPHRDRHGWRYFTPAEAQVVVNFAQASTEAEQPLVLVAGEPRTPYLGKLAAIDWDFADAKTSYLTHGIHPYPAKFIPQIPNALIQLVGWGEGRTPTFHFPRRSGCWGSLRSPQSTRATPGLFNR